MMWDILNFAAIRDILWLLALAGSAGWSLAAFATKKELQKGLEGARKEREVKIESLRTEQENKLTKVRVDQENKVEKALKTHNDEQSRMTDLLWKKLDHIEGKLDKVIQP